MKDKYDRAIEFLTENPREIHHTWLVPEASDAGCLFGPVCPEYDGCGEFPSRPDGMQCGCITQIRVRGGVPDRMNPSVAWTPELTAAIAADERIPTDPKKITVEHLPIFAEWQRRIDRELNRPE